MKRFRNVLSSFLVVCVLIPSLSTFPAYAAEKNVQNVVKQNVESTVSVTGIKLNKTSLSLVNGKTEQLSATISPDDATDKQLYWSTSDSSVCTVDQTGLVSAISDGSAVITVMSNDGAFSAECNVQVTTPLSGIALNKSKTTLAVGGTETLIASLLPTGVAEQSIAWSSSDTNVCTVDSSGIITGVAQGTAVVSATVKNYTATCIVHVIIPVSGITLSKTSLKLKNGASQTLTATIAPKNATEQGLFWTSSNDAVCTVDQTGKITTVNNGSAVIKVTTYDGSFTAECNVTVYTPATGISLNKAKTTLAKGSQETLTAVVSPAGASEKGVFWTSTNGDVCTVDSDGNISGVSEGSAIIIAISKDGGYSAACSVTVVTPATGVTLNKTDLSLENGKSEVLKASIVPDDSTNQDVSWSSSNTAVCTVDQSGKVTAVGYGSAAVTVTTADGGYTAKCNVTVSAAITGISLDKNNLTLSKGTQKNLKATVSPADAPKTDLVWASSDTNVCTVDTSGEVSAVGTGTATISVSTKDGAFSAKCAVTVVVPATGISLSESQMTIEKGKSESLTATINPSDATVQKVYWMSSNKAVCIVDSDGKITAVGNGTATITVLIPNGGFTAKCTVTVITPVSGIKLNKTETSIRKGAKDTLTAAVTPQDASDQTVTWSSSDETVCTVDTSGNLTGIKAGTATITATTKDGGFSATCKVTVTPVVTDIKLSKSTDTLAKGASDTLTATVSPDDAPDKGVTWASSDEKVCTVDQNGKVAAVDVGTAVITAKTNDGGFTASCNVTVSIPVTGISLDQTSLNLTIGDTDKLTATITPAGATDQAVSWSTNNPNIVTVDSNGNVTAVGGGTVIITATTHDGSFSAHCIVNVAMPVSGITISKATDTIKVGSTDTLTAAVAPVNAHDQAVVWSSSDPKIATVDQNGRVSAIAIGKSTITATTHDGGYTAECIVTVPVTYKQLISAGYLEPSKITFGNNPNESLSFHMSTDNYGGLECYYNIIYTFDKPLIMKNGQTLVFSEDSTENTNGPSVLSVYFNGDNTNISGNVYPWSGHDDRTYTFQKDTTLTSITISLYMDDNLSRLHINNHDIHAYLTLNSDYGAFTLNSTGMSS